MELDANVAWPTVLPVNGDNVIYSTIPGEVPYQDPGPIRGAEEIAGWVKSNQAGTFKVNVRNPDGTFTTVNNGGAGDTVGANTWFEIKVKKPSGDFRLVLNWATAPTAVNYLHPTGLVLRKQTT